MFCDAKSNCCLLFFFFFLLLLLLLLLLQKKYFIINYPHAESLLNKRSESIPKCRYENKNILANIKNSKW